MHTTYDMIFQCFVDNTGVDTSRLPDDDYRKYYMIQNGIRHYNIRVDSGDPIGVISGDDSTEELSSKLDDARLMLMAYCLKYVYLENQLVEFEEIWSPFQQELGFKNYRDQISGRESTLQRTEQKIYEYLSKIESKELM